MTYYMETTSGDVATREEWLNDFDATDRESWFGLPIEECEDKEPFDTHHFVEVVKEDGEWVEV